MKVCSLKGLLFEDSSLCKRKASLTRSLLQQSLQWLEWKSSSLSEWYEPQDRNDGEDVSEPLDLYLPHP